MYLIHTYISIGFLFAAQQPVAYCNTCNQYQLGCLKLHNTINNQAQTGVIEICVKDPYSEDLFQFAVVCYVDEDLFNDGSAAAACRQMQYITYLLYGNAD